jgi:hypothetical protein
MNNKFFGLCVLFAFILVGTPLLPAEETSTPVTITLVRWPFT